MSKVMEEEFKCWMVIFLVVVVNNVIFVCV